MVADRSPILRLRARLRTMGDRDFLWATVAYHAAPTLRRWKPATLLCPARSGRRMLACWRRHGGGPVRRFGADMENLRDRHRALLLLVYRDDLLADTLAAPAARALLDDLGYPPAPSGCRPLLDELARRCGPRRPFPHEIGVFLGYPPDDVACFMRRRAGECKAACAWRVYGDVDAARERAALYRRAKDDAAGWLADGMAPDDVLDGLARGG